MSAVHLARVDTGSFTFDAVGMTEDDARRALARGLLAHAVAHDLPGAWIAQTMEDANVTRIPVDGCARDGSVITG